MQEKGDKAKVLIVDDEPGNIFLLENILIEEGLEVELDIGWMQGILEKALSAENLQANIEISLVITGQEKIQDRTTKQNNSLVRQAFLFALLIK